MIRQSQLFGISGWDFDLYKGLIAHDFYWSCSILISLGEEIISSGPGVCQRERKRDRGAQWRMGENKEGRNMRGKKSFNSHQIGRTNLANSRWEDLHTSWKSLPPFYELSMTNPHPFWMVIGQRLCHHKNCVEISEAKWSTIMDGDTTE